MKQLNQLLLVLPVGAQQITNQIWHKTSDGIGARVKEQIDLVTGRIYMEIYAPRLRQS